MRFRWTYVAVLAVPLSALIGCDRPQARFEENERASRLMPAARTAMRTTVEEQFGTPTEMVQWLRFPVGQTAGGQVAESVDAGLVSTFQVSLEPDAAPPAPGGALLWTSGKYHNQQVTIADYDAETGELTIEEALEFGPDGGDQFVTVSDALIRGRHLYAEHCQHCHGVAGDGRGPTAPYLNPAPRDYRLGLFKFTSTEQTDRAQRDDLARIIKYGIPGTYMPSFYLLKDDEMTAIVEYIRWLAMRGEFERRLIDELAYDYSREAVSAAAEAMKREHQQRVEAWKEAGSPAGEQPAAPNASEVTKQRFEQFLEDEYSETIDFVADDIAGAWSKAELESSLVVPRIPRVPDTPESRRIGKMLYLSKKADCKGCHGTAGRGDGPQTIAFQENPETKEQYAEPGLFDRWGNRIQPRDLTRGVYRGGRRPIDLYRRIHAGIKGTPMASFANALTPEEIWHIVNYVLSVPYEQVSPGTHPTPERLASQGEGAH